jgi:hypothetical protein
MGTKKPQYPTEKQKEAEKKWRKDNPNIQPSPPPPLKR